MSVHHGLNYFVKNLSIAIGIILIWRAVWLMLDLLDHLIFGGSHIITIVLGLLVGLIILYLPDRNLKALERL